MRVLICGGRDYSDVETAFNFLNGFHQENKITEIIEGGARGADSIGRQWGKANGIKITTCYADWNKYGRAAGPKRNQVMLELKPDFVIAFPGGKGTADMIKRSENASLKVVRV